MKQYRIDIKPTAARDLSKRYLKIAENSPENAINWYLNITAAIDKLENMPLRCPLAPENIDIQNDLRQLIIGRYRVLYIVLEDTVEILHVRHCSMARKL